MCDGSYYNYLDYNEGRCINGSEDYGCREEDDYENSGTGH